MLIFSDRNWNHLEVFDAGLGYSAFKVIDVSVVLGVPLRSVILEDAYVWVLAVVCVLMNAKECFFVLCWPNFAEAILIFHLTCFWI